MLGTIELWNTRYGFIRTGTIRRGVYLPRDAMLSGAPAVGKRVRFELTDVGLGPRATHVHVIDEDETESCDGK